MQNVLSCSLLSKNIKIKIYRIIIFPVSSMGVKLGFHIEVGTLAEGVCEWGAQDNIWPKRYEVTAGWGKLHSE